jgi:gluconate 2-dehydrogenase gamma chain
MLSDRRSFLSLSGTTLAALLLTADPDEVRAAWRRAHLMATGSLPPAWDYLTAEQAADVEAFASQILPSEPGSPGAREAGAVYFVDQALTTWAKAQREPFTKGLEELNAEVTKRWPASTRFAALTPEKQIEIMKAREKTPFFQQLRAVSLMGVFGNPSYGGNRNKVGWQLLGFEDRFAWQPPFGDYDAAAMKGAK